MGGRLGRGRIASVRSVVAEGQTQEVLDFCKHRVTLGPLEGFNNLVSRIVHRAFGVRDLDYLFLKLRPESLQPDPPT